MRINSALLKLFEWDGNLDNGVQRQQYIQNKVMDEAKRRFVYTNVPISDIAFELLSTVSYFIRSFPATYGRNSITLSENT